MSTSNSPKATMILSQETAQTHPTSTGSDPSASHDGVPLSTDTDGGSSSDDLPPPLPTANHLRVIQGGSRKYCEMEFYESPRTVALWKSAQRRVYEEDFARSIYQRLLSKDMDTQADQWARISQHLANSTILLNLDAVAVGSVILAQNLRPFNEIHVNMNLIIALEEAYEGWFTMIHGTPLSLIRNDR
jgi:hypothetical protein